MNWKNFIKQHNLESFPIGLGGCRTTDFCYDVCDYDITVFDEKSESDKIISFEDDTIHVHHGTLKETKSEILIQYDQMQILQDDSWDLRMFLSKIKEKRINLFNDFAKNSLIESVFCCKKCTGGLESKNVFAPCWQKCASYFLADAICALNQTKPSPSHMLEMVRKFEKNPTNKQFSIVNETVGIERATPTLLERMLKSTIGFSEMIEKNDSSKYISQKHDYFVNNSMISDCYFFLGYLNKKTFVKIKDTIDRQPELIHILKIAFDIESDPELLTHQSQAILNSSRQILETAFQA